MMQPPTTSRFLNEQEPRFQLVVPVPIAVTQIATTGTTLYTAPDTADFLIKRLYVCNVAGAARILNMDIVAPGGSTGATSSVVEGYSVATAALPVLILEDTLIQPGSEIIAQVGAGGTTNDLTMWGWGEERQGAYG